ncbi:unnamed protein product [Amoebophrya sp. A120]|nr:unnamed protein product [Amoebophrya sp. A120]|eukprot:GSA120T00014962001.1
MATTSNLLSSYKKSQAFQKMQQQVESAQLKQQLVRTNTGPVQLDIPFKITLKRVSFNEDSFPGVDSGKCTFVLSLYVSATAKDPAFTSSPTEPASSEAESGFVAWPATSGNTISTTYKTNGFQTFYLRIYRTDKPCLPCCGGGGLARGSPNRGIGTACGMCKLSLGRVLKNLMEGGGDQPLFKKDLYRAGESEDTGHKPIGSLHLGLSCEANHLEAATELLLHALIANARVAEDCGEAAMRMLLEEKDTIKADTYQGVEGNTLLHIACVNGQLEMAQILRKDFGLTIDKLNNKKQTPITAALVAHDIDDGSNILCACTLALELAAGDIEIMFDCVRGARAAGEEAWEGKKARQCLFRLLDLIEEALNSENVARLEQAVNFAQAVNGMGQNPDHPEGKLVDEVRGVTKLVALQLASALNEAEFESTESQLLALNQAVMAAEHQKQHTGPNKKLFARAVAKRNELQRNRMKNLLQGKLEQAIGEQDITQLIGVISYGNALLKANQNMTAEDLPQLAEANAQVGTIMATTLARALASENAAAMQHAIAQCENFKLDGHELCRAPLANLKAELVMLPKRTCLKKLEAAIEQLNTNPEGFHEYMFSLTVNQASELQLEQHPTFLTAVDVYKRVKNLPETFDALRFIKKDTYKPEMTDELLQVMQKLCDATFVRKYTRDRHGGNVPQGIEVCKVVQVQQPNTYLSYTCRRDQIFDNLKALRNTLGKNAFARYDTELDFGIKTYKAQKEWAPVTPLAKEPISPHLNEFYLWHGTKPDAATAITSSDFRLDLSGSHAGTLYGKGLYFAEACSKSDEYTEPEYMTGLRPLLLCRVVLGNVYYTDEIHPNVDSLVQKCTRGPYDSVLGDREKCRDTFRELVSHANRSLSGSRLQGFFMQVFHDTTS